jgi:hypothetical protein
MVRVLKPVYAILDFPNQVDYQERGDLPLEMEEEPQEAKPLKTIEQLIEELVSSGQASAYKYGDPSQRVTEVKVLEYTDDEWNKVEETPYSCVYDTARARNLNDEKPRFSEFTQQVKDAKAFMHSTDRYNVLRLSIHGEVEYNNLYLVGSKKLIQAAYRRILVYASSEETSLFDYINRCLISVRKYDPLHYKRKKKVEKFWLMRPLKKLKGPRKDYDQYLDQVKEFVETEELPGPRSEELNLVAMEGDAYVSLKVLDQILSSQQDVRVHSPGWVNEWKTAIINNANMGGLFLQLFKPEGVYNPKIFGDAYEYLIGALVKRKKYELADALIWLLFMRGTSEFYQEWVKDVT